MPCCAGCGSKTPCRTSLAHRSWSIRPTGLDGLKDIVTSSARQLLVRISSPLPSTRCSNVLSFQKDSTQFARLGMQSKITLALCCTCPQRRLCSLACMGAAFCRPTSPMTTEAPKTYGYALMLVAAAACMRSDHCSYSSQHMMHYKPCCDAGRRRRWILRRWRRWVLRWWQPRRCGASCKAVSTCLSEPQNSLSSLASPYLTC